MALTVRGLGHPWIHSGVACSHCQVSPIEGYRYKCEICSDHNLCEKCYRQGQPHSWHRFVQIARDSSQYHPPFQVYYIVCNDCGQAPIEGRCHRHKWRPNLYVCNDCYSRRPASANPAAEWEVLDEPKISTICRTHSPVYHFHRQCGSCGVSPITGPRFDSLTYPEYSLCLICFDEKFIKGSVKNEDFLRMERPEAHKVRHVFMYACRNCGEVPIDGPAYINKRLQDKVLCLLCYMNVQAQAQLEYSRVDPPSQYGEPPPRASAQVTAGTVSLEEYTRLAQEFEIFREEKEVTARVVASNFLNRANEIENLRKELEEARRVSVDYSSLAQELEISKADQEQMSRMQEDFDSLVEKLKRLTIEKDEAIKASADYSSLTQELERLRAEEEEFMTVHEQYLGISQELEKLKIEKEEAVKVSADYSSLVLEVERLKDEMEEKGEAAELALVEISRLVKEVKRLEDEKVEAVRVSAEKYAILMEENEQLKAEKEEAAEYSSLAKELEMLEEREKEEGTKSPADYPILVQEVERLKEENFSLAQELETLREQAGRVSTEEYVSLTKEFGKYREENERAAEATQAEFLTLAQEFELMKEEKELVLRGKLEEHANLVAEFEIHKLQKGELEQANTDLVKKYEKLIVDKAWLIQEMETVYREKEEAAIVSAESDAILVHEVRKMKEEKDEAVRARLEDHTNMMKEYEKLKLENEAVVELHASLARRFEKLQYEKEESAKVSAEEYVSIVNEVARLKEEKEETEKAATVTAGDYTSLREEFEKFRIEKEKALEKTHLNLRDECEKLKGDREEIATLHSNLVQKLEKLEEELNVKEETARMAAAEYLGLHKEFEILKKEKEGLSRQGQDYEVLKKEFEKLKGAKEAAAALSSSLAHQLEILEAEAEEQYSRLAEEFDRYKQDKGKIVVANTPEYKNLLREYEKMKIGKAEEYTRIFDDFRALEEEIEELRTASGVQYSSLTQEYEKLKAEKADAMRKSAEDYARLSEELESWKSTFAFDLPGISKCAQVAVCTYGAIVLQKKISLEQGYAKSTLSRADSKTLHQAEQFISETVKELDIEYEEFKHQAQTVTDDQVREFYINTALPALKKKTKLKAGGGDISQLSIELAAAKKTFGK